MTIRQIDQPQFVNCSIVGDAMIGAAWVCMHIAPEWAHTVCANKRFGTETRKIGGGRLEAEDK